MRDNNLYIGITSNLKQRFYQHDSGNVPSTKFRRPIKLIFYEGYILKSDAMRRERYFKSAKGKSTIRAMLKDYLSVKV